MQPAGGGSDHKHLAGTSLSSIYWFHKGGSVLDTVTGQSITQAQLTLKLIPVQRL